MSHTDNSRLPALATTRVVESDYMGTFTYTIAAHHHRADHRADREHKREMAQSGSGRKATLAEIDAREQVREAVYGPTYTGPVGTPKKMALWEHTLLSESTRIGTAFAFANRLPSRDEVYGNVQVQVQHSTSTRIEPVVPRTRTVKYLDRQAQEILKRKAERRAMREAQDDLDEIARMRDMRDLGFGGRYGVYLED